MEIQLNTAHLKKQQQQKEIKLEEEIKIIENEVNVNCINMSEETLNNLKTKKTMLNNIQKEKNGRNDVEIKKQI